MPSQVPTSIRSGPDAGLAEGGQGQDQVVLGLVGHAATHEQQARRAAVGPGTAHRGREGLAHHAEHGRRREAEVDQLLGR